MKDINILINEGVNINKGIELMGDQATYDELLGDFLIEADKKLISIQNYKEKEDMKNYAILTHSLKSDGRTFGFDSLAEIAYNHEMESKRNNVIYVNEHYNELILEANRIIELVKRYLGDENNQKTNNDNKNITSGKYNTLLVVDDSVIIRNFIKKAFDETLEVLVANDGREAINIINQNAYKLVGVLLDLNMPNMDGFEVLEYFKEKKLFDNIPVSIITGDDSRERLEKAFSYPVVDILKKPFNEDDIKKFVERTMRFHDYRG